MAFWDNHTLNKNDEDPKTANGNTYNYEVTNNETKETEYLTQKGYDCVKDK